MINNKKHLAKKIGWNFLIKHGHITKGEWDYYLGNFNYVENNQNLMKEIKNNIVLFGVDWEKTDLPISDKNCAFNGTENDSIWSESLIGNLYLNNGNSYKLGTNKNFSFSSYVKEICDIIELVSDPDFDNNLFKDL